VTSQTVGVDDCKQFAENLRLALQGTPIQQVVYTPPTNRLPTVVPVEYRTTWAVDITGRKLTMKPPRPRAFDAIKSSPAWFVDLVDDVKTGRAVKELQLPPSPVVSELLNGPCPPGYEQSVIPRTGDGWDCVNVRCSGEKEVINFLLPTAEEVLEELLRESGLEPVPDEKRSSYLPVIRRFGGLQQAAAAFSGKSGTVLTALKDEPRTLREIKGKCELGDGTLPGESYASLAGSVFGSESERIRRIASQRFAHYSRHQSPENLKLASVLEFWADRLVVSREWRIGPCPRCRRSFFVPRLDIQRRVPCPNCGNRITLKESVPLGYSLHPAVRLAIEEGIVPVVLAGRFLRGMTANGFMWLPGVKYKADDKFGDIDLLASCDGNLVFCECKQLRSTPPDTKVWNDVVVQFVETVSVAVKCGGKLAILAAQVERFPQEVVNQIKASIGSTIPVLFLNNQDLEAGYRNIQDGDQSRWLRLPDLLPVPFPEQQREPAAKPLNIIG
jgi:DNA-directed RNA polymerase subunit RPC12/RpoP